MKLYFYLFLFTILFIGGFTRGYAQSIGVSISDTTVDEGDSFTRALVVDSSMTGHDVLSYQLRLRFSANYLELNEITTNGTLSENWQVSVNNDVDGEIIVAAAGGSALSGTGILFNMHFTTRRSGSSNIAFYGGDTDNYLNEGSPALTTDNGYVRIDALPRLSLSPSSDLLTRGDQRQFSVSGGTAPYQWSVTNPGVASIDTNGLLTAENPGTTGVIAEDATGIIDTTGGLVEVRGFKLFSVDTTEFQGLETVIPIYVSDLSGLNINSGRFDLRFNTNQFTLTELVTTESLLENSSELSWSSRSNGARIAFATSQSLAGDGILLYARLFLNPDYSGYHSIYFEDILFNETLAGNQERFNFRVFALPDLSLSPTSAQLLVGDSLQFEVTNNTGAVTWFVSDGQKAHIDSNGWFYADQGGAVTVTATDSISATGTTNTISIFDIEVSLPDTSGIVGDTLLFPINITNLPTGQPISSIEGAFSFNENVVKLTEIVTPGSMSDGWSFTVRASSGQLTYAGAGSNAVNAEGTLFYVRGVIDTSLTYRQTTGINLQQLTLNEGMPTARTVNGVLEVNVAVEAPVLQSPSNGASNLAIDADFEWASVNGAASYQLQISDDNSFSTVFADTSDITATTARITNLSTATTYYWRVRGFSTSGTAGVWSTTYSFSTVDFVNSTPYLLNAFADLTIEEDFQSFTAASLDTVFEEPDGADGDSLVYDAVLSSAIMNVTIDGNQMNVSSIGDSNGVVQVIITATDIYSASVADTFLVTINPVNDIPTLTLPSDTLYFQNDSTVTMDIWAYAGDVETDVDQLTFSFEPDTADITTSFNGSTGQLSIEAPGYEGRGFVRISVTDPQLASTVDTLYLQVSGVNAAPVVTVSLPDITEAEDFTARTVAKMDTLFNDADGDSLTYSLSVSNPIADAFINMSLELRIESKPDSNGTTTLTLRATDPAGAFVEDAFTLTVSPVNDIPVWSLPNDTLKFSNDSLVTISLWDHVQDIEEKAADLSYDINPAISDIQTTFNSSNGILSIEAPGFTGLSHVVVTATDSGQGTSSDTLFIHLTTSTGISTISEMPLSYELYTNYPNPFNPSTNIRYALPEAAHVRLQVYNMNGQIVTTLVNQVQSAGSHKLVFKGDNLSSGIYFIQLLTPKYQKMRKMMLLK